ncbi:hypothetical protein J2125_002803 [Erwinia toletana]|uniref:Uncharacterized protein n=1 Tax=Winslowiella toletana TaxID=92490 RepID=A0ABS4PAD3_9GAMM|nr:hypothetical protein [Winslowiella toletana]MBP2169611.1 hypothetical protein [Winslowiella toletana]
MVGEISHQHQIRLFEVVYPQKAQETEISYHKNNKGRDGAIPWDSLDSKIRDVMVDIYYQEFNDATNLCKAAMQNSRIELIEYIKNNARLMKFESTRKRIPYLNG